LNLIRKTTKTAEFIYWLLLSFADWSKIEKVLMMMMMVQYTNCVVN